MSTKLEKKSGEGRGHPDENSVFDFLYHDARRIGSFLSQFDPNGHLQSLTSARGVSESAASKAGVNSSFGLPAVAKVDLPLELNENVSSSDSESRSYDPIWANALAFLDYLQQKSLIQKDPYSASIGQFIQCSGELTLVDLSFLQQMYRIEGVIARARSTPNPQTGQPRTKEEVDLDLDALQAMPAQTQVYLRCDDEAILFGSLKVEGMVAPASDLMMKYGSTLDGVWTIVGIKDAEPIVDVEDWQQAQLEAMEPHRERPWMTEYIDMANRSRLWVGRPNYCFGVTPLAVLRTIGS